VHIIDYFPLARRIVARSNAIGVVAAPYATLPSFQARFAILDKAAGSAPVPDVLRHSQTPGAETRGASRRQCGEVTPGCGPAGRPGAAWRPST
jgi:hypothetical protein